LPKFASRKMEKKTRGDMVFQVIEQGANGRPEKMRKKKEEKGVAGKRFISYKIGKKGTRALKIGGKKTTGKFCAIQKQKKRKTGVKVGWGEKKEHLRVHRTWENLGTGKIGKRKRKSRKRQREWKNDGKEGNWGTKI